MGLAGLERVRLRHEAVPYFDFEDIRLDSTCLGRPSRTPFYISGMTAGHADAAELNRLFAVACAARGWAFGVGSQRRELDGDAKSQVDDWAKIRESAPNLVLFANIGLTQLAAAPIEKLRALVLSSGAQALAVHANALQEALQPEGTPRFRGAIEALGRVGAELGVPVILKETGCGFTRSTLERLSRLGLAAVDVSGLGGTHWGRIEGARAGEGMRADAARTFANWGEPTVDSLLAARVTLGPSTEIWASGGIRTGLDAAKCLALGARQVGFAQPALEAALAGEAALIAWMERQEFELRVALFCTGSPSPERLREQGAEVSP